MSLRYLISGTFLVIVVTLSCKKELVAPEVGLQNIEQQHFRYDQFDYLSETPFTDIIEIFDVSRDRTLLVGQGNDGDSKFVYLRENGSYAEAETLDLGDYRTAGMDIIKINDLFYGLSSFGFNLASIPILWMSYDQGYVTNSFSFETFDLRLAAMTLVQDSFIVCAGTTDASLFIGLSDRDPVFTIHDLSLDTILHHQEIEMTEYQDVIDITSNSDGTFVIWGTYDQIPSPQTLFGIKVDLQGNVLWSRNFDQVIVQGGHLDCQPLFDGSTLVFYTSPSPINNNSNLHLMKCSATGDIAWIKEYGGPDTEQSGEIFLTSRDEILLSGETNSYGEGKNNIILIKTDLNGSPDWFRTFGDRYPNQAKTITENGNGFILGGTSFIQKEHLDYEVFTLAFDHDGIPIE